MILDYTNEAGIRGYVTIIYKEILRYAGLQYVIKIREETSLLSLRPDHLVLNNPKNVPIGVSEVKPPLKDSRPRPSSFGQLFNYLLILKHRYGIKEPFGILTTYESFFICWLKKGNQGADKTVYGEEYKWSNKELPYALAALFTKMLQSERQVIKTGINKEDFYMQITSDSIEWTKVDWKSKSINYDQMPNDNTTQFYILKDLGGGRDGRVHQACDQHGAVCVIKFLASAKKANQEAECWQAINANALQDRNTYVRRMILGQSECLIMPFVKFSMADRKNKEVSKALMRMVRAGYVHKDLKWEHVGTINNKVVFIDFSDMQKLNNPNPTECKNKVDEMLNNLELNPKTVSAEVSSVSQSEMDESEASEMDTSMDTSTSFADSSFEEKLKSYDTLELLRVYNKFVFKGRKKSKLNKRDKLVEYITDYYVASGDKEYLTDYLESINNK